MSTAVLELADIIKERGRRSTQELPPLLERAESFAQDETLDVFSRALAHRAAGNALQMLDRFQPALIRYNNAIAMLETLDAPAELGRTLHAKVGLLFFLSRFDELMTTAERARGLFETLGDRQRLARLDVNLSHAYHRLDRYGLSLECAERALPILKETGDREGYLAAAMNSAVALAAMHRFAGAEDRYREALDLAEAMGMTVWARHCRYNLAYLRYLGGNTADALERLGAAKAEYAAAGEDRNVCLCLLDEAEILIEIGDAAASTDAARRAGELARALNLNLEMGKAMLFEAFALLRQQRQEDAAPLLDAAARQFQAERNGVWKAVGTLHAALFRSADGDEHVLQEALSARAALAESELPHRLALADIVIGRLERASLPNRADGARQRSIAALRSALAWAERGQSDWMRFHAAYELGVSLSEKGPAGSVDAVDTGEALGLFEHAERQLDRLWDRLGSDDLKLAFLNDRETVYSRLLGLTAARSVESAFTLAEKSRSRVLSERLLPFRPELTDLQQRLDTDEVILEYFVAGDDLTLFVVTGSDVKRITQPGAAVELRSRCENLDRHLASCSVKWEYLAGAHGHLRRTALDHLRALYDLLIAPAAESLRARLVVVPHGFLHGVPFHALWDGARFLSDTVELTYSPSAALYCQPAQTAFSGRPLFIAFAPAGRSAFAPTGRTALAPGGRITAVAEAEECAALYANAEVAVNPSLAQLRALLEQPRALAHISGHAGIDAVGGTFSWIETAEGRLTGRDLTNMSIRATTIVVTGCQTARRVLLPGDEWQGLMRAFYLSGAATIVSAFWDIRDESARRFAAEFHRRFDGRNAPKAAGEASRAIRAWRDHPYFWAGFGVFKRKDIQEEP